ncbi:hypothetical protein [Paraburkholderia phenazinium]|jgi:uncharacterized membrane protein|uniref:Uncharacterized membrane protein n=1 Tax=Paraburkholderia phenazinium TaxID=60549 RepID=A0A1G7UCN2_9BURK|nr:hypothetical protein [Paraburkholderia phenazinium]SDG44510.1 Uncharacterized membrane protein [Paraburkholderia phenazinium]
MQRIDLIPDARTRISLPRILRGAGTVGVIAACEIGTHYAASTPRAQGFGLAVVVAPLLLIGLAAAARAPQRAWLLPLWACFCAALWLAREPLIRHFGWGAYLEQLSFNLIMAFVFGRTLAAGRQPLCSQFATMVHGTLTPAVAHYTRQITLAWTGFFLLVASVSTLLFVTSPLVVWSTFANYMTLPLVVVMFVGEHAWRRIALPNVKRSSMLAAARAYRHTMHGRAERAQ